MGADLSVHLPGTEGKTLVQRFEDLVHNHDFPCIGAKTALAYHQMEFCVADDIRTSSSDTMITRELQDFAARCSPESLFVSFVVIFQNSPPMTEAEFERHLWRRLQGIHKEDALSHDWAPEYSDDADSPFFAMSVGGAGFYIVGLHPNSGRNARRFEKAALVFNLHSQFELLKLQGHYATLSHAIRKHDEEVNGDANPMLAEHGVISEARQYSGRVVGPEWHCPFHPAAHSQPASQP